MKVLQKADVLLSLSLLGIEPGDTLLLHSALTAVGPVEGGADTVIDAFLEALGPEGTLCMSTLTGWDAPFDANNSPSAVGWLSEAFRRRPGVYRSLHPVHSVAAFGRHGEFITRGHENCPTGCGEGTPYLKIRDLGGKALLLGVDMDRNTIMHSLEEAAVVPYLVELDIPAPTYLPGQAHFTLHSFPPGHRDFMRLTPVLRRAGLLREGRIGQAVVKAMPLKPLFELGAALLAKDPFFFICENESCNFCRKTRNRYAGAAVSGGEGRCVDPDCEVCVLEP